MTEVANGFSKRDKTKKQNILLIVVSLHTV